MKPFRIKFTTVLAIPLEQHRSNVTASRFRERIRPVAGSGLPLAIVGGGPSVLGQLEELRSWPGEIWAINATCEWLSSVGIASKLVTVDSSIKSLPRPALCTGALFASCVDPAVWDQHPDALCFDLVEDDPTGVVGGSTTACRLPIVCLQMGYTEIHYFGCEGSFVGKTHAYKDEGQFLNLMKIEAAGKVYTTRDDLLLQCECLADIMREFPNNLKNRSGGLLQAMTDDQEWRIVAVSAALREQLLQNEVQVATYDEPYREAA